MSDGEAEITINGVRHKRDCICWGCSVERNEANRKALVKARDAVISAAKARIRADNKLGLHKAALEDRVWHATIKLIELERE